jgi:hypothetical protein
MPNREYEELGKQILSELSALVEGDPEWQRVSAKDDNAFEVALIVARSLYAAGLTVPGLDVKIVHGTATTLSAPHKKYDHAWVEIVIPGLVPGEGATLAKGAIDLSNGSRSVMTTQKYRELSNVDEYSCRSYGMLEFVQLVANLGTFGPFPLTSGKPN